MSGQQPCKAATGCTRKDLASVLCDIDTSFYFPSSPSGQAYIAELIAEMWKSASPSARYYHLQLDSCQALPSYEDQDLDFGDEVLLEYLSDVPLQYLEFWGSAQPELTMLPNAYDIELDEEYWEQLSKSYDYWQIESPVWLNALSAAELEVAK
ncbi:hypothetical protein K488DRAFT_70706 [Vararia minispora EC-137]|uniref:Uncharacterized protein n=1 Tax=Vararia minispora EC-137 TaxID=1314806 RepID=A0ACB8QL05_9AGAM|nr:hypothetical protein K488DRAFT_70706 [Vararia minispora EC-137]